MLGRTVAGYLLVSIFFAYDVALYLFTTQVVRLVDAVRGAAASRRARDLRAVAVGDRQLVPGGLLGRGAVPRGADRGRRAHRRSLRQAATSSSSSRSSCRRSSSAPATRRIRPSPPYARPVELILPSIGFGLLYLYFGLLPGIVLHFAFDVVWFALPIFLADAPGIWLQQAMVVLITLVPLWIVLWRRVQAGRWTVLVAVRSQRGVDASSRRRAAAGGRRPPHRAIGPAARKLWLGLGAASLLCLWTADRCRPRRRRRAADRPAGGGRHRAPCARRPRRDARPAPGACCRCPRAAAAERTSSWQRPPATSGARS